jgi:hypothetical protein
MMEVKKHPRTVAIVIQQQLLELEEEVQQLKDDQAKHEPKRRRLNTLQAILRRLLYARE